MKATGINHIGIVVDNLDEAVAFMGKALGSEVIRTIEAPDRGGVRAAFVTCGDAQIELMEFNDPEARAKKLGNDIARIEHIAVDVDDVGAAYDELREKGVRFEPEELEEFNGYKLAFTNPASSDGIMYQLVDYGK
jgi:methylmalonyl-CoA/ethylmalonyl-CoA epimerase